MLCCEVDNGVQTRNDASEERFADRRDSDEIISGDVRKDQLEHVKIQVVCRDHCQVEAMRRVSSKSSD
jgi:hypothetical protein